MKLKLSPGPVFFGNIGMKLVQSAADVDVVIFNTCAVTAKAGRKSRNGLTRVQKYHPQIQLVTMGCYPTLVPKELADTLGVDWVIPTERVRFPEKPSPCL